MLGHLARRAPGRVRRARRTTPTGWPPRPTPSSRAGPTGPTRCSASWWPRPSSGPRAASRTCSTSTPSPDGVPGFRRVSEEELLRAWLFAVVRLAAASTPTGRPFERVVVRHPGAVTVVPLHDDGTVTLVRQYRAAVDAMVLEIPAGTRDRTARRPRTRPAASWPRRPASRRATRSCSIGTWNTPGVSDQRTMIYPGHRAQPVPAPARRDGGALP